MRRLRARERMPAGVSRLRLVVPTKDILNDRGMMGDGVIDITSVRSAVEAQGFAAIPRSKSSRTTGGTGLWTRF